MNDADLIKLFASTRDEAAFAILVDRHGPMVLGICRRILRNTDDAEDAFQATFLLLAIRARKIRQPHLLGNWLFGVATRTALNARRLNQRRAVQEKRLMRTLRHKSRDISYDADLHLTLDEEINRLPDKYRKVVVSCYLLGMTKREAAKHLKWPEGTVATRLSHALQLLRERLAGKSDSGSLDALTALLAPVAVPVTLSASTVKAATLAAAGKLAVVGAVSAKAVTLAKGASKAMLVAKIKLAAAMVLASTLTIAAATTVSQLRAQRSVTPTSAPSVSTEPQLGRTERIKTVTLSIIRYANAHTGHLPPDLGATLAFTTRNRIRAYLPPEDDAAVQIPEPPTPQWVNEHTSLVYLGKNTMTLAGSANTPVIRERFPGDGAPVLIGFLDGHVEALPEVTARERSEGVPLQLFAADGAPLIFAPTFSQPATRPDVALPANIHDALESNAAQVSPITIAWTEHGTATLSTDAAIRAFHIHEQFFNRHDWRVICRDGKLYDWNQFPDSDGTRFSEAACDGQVMYRTIPVYGGRPNASQFHKRFVKRMTGSGGFPDPYLQAVGLRLPFQSEPLSPKPTSHILNRIRNNALLVAVNEALIDGQPMVRLSLLGSNPDQWMLHGLPTGRYYDFFLDPQMRFAVRRIEERYENQLLTRTDNSRFEQVPGRQLWLPRHSSRNYYTWNTTPDKFFSHPILGEEIDVTELSFGPAPDDQFVLKPLPRAQIFDQTSETGPQKAAVGQVLSQVPSVPQVVGYRWRWTIIIWICAAGALALGTSVWWHRHTTKRRRQRIAASPSSGE